MKDNYIVIKDTVRFLILTRPIIRALSVILDTWTYYGQIPTITSANDSTHRADSLHYKNMALDLRIKDLPVDYASSIFNMLKKSLGYSYDVVLESDHIHIEFDPKEV